MALLHAENPMVFTQQTIVELPTLLSNLGINAKGYGDYGNDYDPELIASDINIPKGCLINDDLDSNLEAR